MAGRKWMCRFILALVMSGGGTAALAQGDAAGPTFGTPEQQQGLIAGICLSQLNIGETGCACLAARAMTDLDEPQRTYLIMTVVQPPVAERLPTASSEPDIKAIATFLETAGQDCAAASAAPAQEGGTTAEPQPQEGEAQ